MKRIFLILFMAVFFVAFGAGYIISVPEAGACGPGCPGCNQTLCEQGGGFCELCQPGGSPGCKFCNSL